MAYGPTCGPASPCSSSPSCVLTLGFLPSRSVGSDVPYGPPIGFWVHQVCGSVFPEQYIVATYTLSSGPPAVTSPEIRDVARTLSSHPRFGMSPEHSHLTRELLCRWTMFISPEIRYVARTLSSHPRFVMLPEHYHLTRYVARP
jgi:hypothetical protein